MTLTTMALGRPTLLKQAGLVLGGTLVLAAASQVSVPFYPVPVTLQTLAVLLVGLTLGARLGAITVLAWLGEAALGAPVLANFMNGAAFAGPTAGFLVGFVGMAYLAGLATDRGVTDPVRLSLVTLVASALLYVPGLAWPLGVAQIAGIEAGWAMLSPEAVFGAFMLPFLPGDALKAVIAALIVSGATKALSSKRI
ncbi:Biotin ECF transporter S component BioY [Jannaschia seosinensis]|uniref:Biotin transporter n=1 Tax=Jannaschia seosinensis TaxID=313367 RepID=A0A0M7BFT5_9RHOB|nr:biotin transporter BioY [Jannaschia seosinensis]CUH40948.1 Biotin ECF transporter S component BioY [Jannaschia seosinensis]